MNKYEFTLVLKESPQLSEEVADQLFAAGCDDGTPGTCDGLFTIDFHRTAESLEAAMSSAAANVRTAGFNVEYVEIEAGAIPQMA